MGVVWGMGSVGIFVEVDHLAWTSYREIPTGCLRRRDGCRSVCLAGWLVMGCAQAKGRDLRGGDAGSAHAGTVGI